MPPLARHNGGDGAARFAGLDDDLAILLFKALGAELCDHLKCTCRSIRDHLRRLVRCSYYLCATLVSGNGSVRARTPARVHRFGALSHVNKVTFSLPDSISRITLDHPNVSGIGMLVVALHDEALVACDVRSGVSRTGRSFAHVVGPKERFVGLACDARRMLVHVFYAAHIFTVSLAEDSLPADSSSDRLAECVVPYNANWSYSSVVTFSESLDAAVVVHNAEDRIDVYIFKPGDKTLRFFATKHHGGADCGVSDYVHNLSGEAIFRTYVSFANTPSSLFMRVDAEHGIAFEETTDVESSELHRSVVALPGLAPAPLLIAGGCVYEDDEYPFRVPETYINGKKARFSPCPGEFRLTVHSEVVQHTGLRSFPYRSSRVF